MNIVDIDIDFQPRRLISRTAGILYHRDQTVFRFEKLHNEHMKCGEDAGGQPIYHPPVVMLCQDLGNKVPEPVLPTTFAFASKVT